MILGVGIDIADVRRWTKLMARRPAILERIFTAAEREACLSQSAPERSFAARFAAKEACLKALGTGWGQGLGFLHVEVSGGRGTQPSLRLHGPAAERFAGMGGKALHLSLTHEGDTAAAVVILEK